MQFTKLSKARTLSYAVLIASAVLAFDLYMQLGVAAGVPYVALVLLGLWAPSKRYILNFAITGSILILVGYLFSADGGVLWIVLTNRALAFFVIWSTAMLAMHWKQGQEDLEQAHDDLEQRIIARTAELQQSEQKYSRIFNSAQVGIIRTRLDDGTVIDANECIAQMLGYKSRSELLETYDPTIHWPSMKSREHWTRRAMDRNATLSGVLALRKLDNTKILLQSSAVFHPELNCIDNISIDITEAKQQEKEIIKAREDAEYNNRLKSEFLGSFSHELRTPLNAIIGFSDTMEQEILGPLGNDRYREYAHDIKISGQHLLALINDLVDLSRIESGNLVLDEQLVDAKQIVVECTRLMAVQAENKSVTIELQPGAADLYINADGRQLRQILLNILSNAVKYTNPNTLIKVSSGISPSDEIFFKITDQGNGMSASDVKRVQEPFLRLESAVKSSEEGSGLGLAITKRLVESHGGRLEIDSIPGTGTTVTAILPPERRATAEVLTLKTG